MTPRLHRLTCYSAGAATALAVVALEVLPEGTGYVSEELGPLVLKSLLVLGPFVILGGLGRASKRTIVALVLSTAAFWCVYMVAAARSVGGMNFGLGLAALLSPLLVGAVALAIDRVFAPRGGMPPDNSFERTRE